MKRIGLIVGLVVFALNMSGKSGVYENGYRGDVGISTLEIVQRHLVGHLIQAETVQGYSFGNGGFIGMGTGLSFN